MAVVSHIQCRQVFSFIKDQGAVIQTGYQKIDSGVSTLASKIFDHIRSFTFKEPVFVEVQEFENPRPFWLSKGEQSNSPQDTFGNQKLGNQDSYFDLKVKDRAPIPYKCLFNTVRTQSSFTGVEGVSKKVEKIGPSVLFDPLVECAKYGKKVGEIQDEEKRTFIHLKE
jgi:hypothetical protein